MSFTFIKKRNEDISSTAGVAHPVSDNFKIHFPDIPSQKVANSASRKRPGGPHKMPSEHKPPLNQCLINRGVLIVGGGQKFSENLINGRVRISEGGLNLEIHI